MLTGLIHTWCCGVCWRANRVASKTRNDTIPWPELEPSITTSIGGDLDGKCFPQAPGLEHVSLVGGAVWGSLGSEDLGKEIKVSRRGTRRADC